jgi:hypothetical protein
MRKLNLLIKVIKESPVLVKIMWVNFFVILFITVAGMIFKFENTIVVVGLNVVQIIIFLKSKKELDIKYKELKIEINQLPDKMIELFDVDKDFHKKLKNLADFAESNPFSTNELIQMHNGNSKKVGNIEGFFLWAPLNTKIVYCIENDGSKDIRFLSVSFMDARVRPPIQFVQKIMEMIGFDSPITECTVGFEEVNGKENIVIIREVINRRF